MADLTVQTGSVVVQTKPVEPTPVAPGSITPDTRPSPMPTPTPTEVQFNCNGIDARITYTRPDAKPKCIIHADGSTEILQQSSDNSSGTSSTIIQQSSSTTVPGNGTSINSSSTIIRQSNSTTSGNKNRIIIKH